MRITAGVCLVSLALALTAVGCSKKKVDLSELESAFKGSEAQLAGNPNQAATQNPQPLLQQAQEAIKNSDYAGALVPLTALRSQPTLTAEQLTAVQDTVAAVNKQMAESANAGDPAAQKALEDYRQAKRAMRQR